MDDDSGFFVIVVLFNVFREMEVALDSTLEKELIEWIEEIDELEVVLEEEFSSMNGGLNCGCWNLEMESLLLNNGDGSSSKSSCISSSDSLSCSCAVEKFSDLFGVGTNLSLEAS